MCPSYLIYMALIGGLAIPGGLFMPAIMVRISLGFACSPWTSSRWRSSYSSCSHPHERVKPLENASWKGDASTLHSTCTLQKDTLRQMKLCFMFMMDTRLLQQS